MLFSINRVGNRFQSTNLWTKLALEIRMIVHEVRHVVETSSDLLKTDLISVVHLLMTGFETTDLLPSNLVVIDLQSMIPGDHHHLICEGHQCLIIEIHA